jgi:hypothetical protein
MFQNMAEEGKDGGNKGPYSTATRSTSCHFFYT